MAAERNPAEGDRAGRDPAGQEALLAAITGEPLPPGAGADARTSTGRRSPTWRCCGRSWTSSGAP